MIYVLDASAMIAYLRAEPGGHLVRDTLQDSSNQCFAHVLNFCEVYYDFYRAESEKIAAEAMRDLEAVGISLRDDISQSFWQAAGKLKAIRRRNSLADCFAVTLARHLGGTLISADHHELDPLAASGDCVVLFIR